MHAIGGIIGALLTGIFAAEMFGGSGGLVESGIPGQLFNQAVAVVVTVVYSGGLSFIILKVIDKVIGLRVSDEEEEQGLDLASHDERGYVL